MRLSVACLLVALALFAANALVWSRLGTTPPPATFDPIAVVRAFEREHTAVTIDVGALYAGRLDLVDARHTLPAWHRFDRAAAVELHQSLAHCPPAPLAAAAARDASLAKAYEWHARTCGGRSPENLDLLLGRPPYMHPTGRSYAALAFTLPGAGPARADDFHVLELAALDRASLTAAQRALADLPGHGWQALTRGDDAVLTDASLVMAEHGPLGLAKLRVHDRPAWEAFARRAGAALVQRPSSLSCARPASSKLCWEALSLPARYRTTQTVTTATSTALLAMAAIALVVVFMRERRRTHADRIHVLRTLTHELRTPATSLRIDIEPLRAAYDALPASCQDPLLRISDGIERLHRVLHRSARYMALFETPGAARSSLLTMQTVPSVRELFEALADEWPEDVTMKSSSTDAAIVTDPEWLGIALRNLVENASRHGKPPVTVEWELSQTELVVRVVDQGTTPALVLRNATNPFERAARSEGLGLGLAIVAKVAELFRGRLSHESKPTAFELRLPASRGIS